MLRYLSSAEGGSAVRIRSKKGLLIFLRVLPLVVFLLLFAEIIEDQVETVKDNSSDQYLRTDQEYLEVGKAVLIGRLGHQLWVSL
jgi:hypothetical protein